MSQLADALRRMPTPLWIVLACGIVTGAMVAHEATTPAPVALSAPATAVSAAAPPSERTGVAPGTPLRLLDSKAPANAPARSSGGGLLRGLAMMALLGAGVAALWFLRKKGAKGGGKRAPDLELLGSLRVGGRWQVSLVRVPGKTLVLGATDKGLTLLATLGEGDDAVTAEAVAWPEVDEGELLGYASPPAAPRAPAPAPDLDLTGSSAGFFNRLLDQLAGEAAPSAATPSQAAGAEPRPAAATTGVGRAIPARERPPTPQAEALRARLERVQRMATS